MSIELIVAVRNSRFDEVEELLDEGHDVNFIPDEYEAAELGSDNIIIGNNSPLYTAIFKSQNVAMAKLLIERGANLEISRRAKNISILAELVDKYLRHNAAHPLNLEVLHLLIHNGANLRTVHPFCGDLTFAILNSRAQNSFILAELFFHEALFRADESIVKLLLKKKDLDLYAGSFHQYLVQKQINLTQDQLNHCNETLRSLVSLDFIDEQYANECLQSLESFTTKPSVDYSENPEIKALQEEVYDLKSDIAILRAELNSLKAAKAKPSLNDSGEELFSTELFSPPYFHPSPRN